MANCLRFAGRRPYDRLHGGRRKGEEGRGKEGRKEGRKERKKEGKRGRKERRRGGKGREEEGRGRTVREREGEEVEKVLKNDGQHEWYPRFGVLA